MVSKFKPFIAVFLLAAVFFIMTGCTNTKETTSSEEGDTENIKILTGAVDVEGSGVSITLTDGKAKKDNINNNFVHNADLMKMVNLLTNAGAEVISINDERLISTSKIKANKMKIKINNNEYNAPFTIKAIGDTKSLMDALNEKTSYAQQLKEYVKVKIEKKDKLLIPKYKGNIDFKYAKPLKNQEK